MVDVTWRYSVKHTEVMQRRNECDEIWLAKHTSELSKRRQRGLSKDQIESIQLRMVSEVVEFMTPNKIKEGEDIGRQSGSLQWRLTRGEIQLPTVIHFSFESFTDFTFFILNLKKLNKDKCWIQF